MNIDLTADIFHDDNKARAWLENARWGNEPSCSHCGSVNVVRMEGDAHRPGLLSCRDCRKQFSVTVGSVMERSHVALSKWVLAFHLMSSSKKGMSAHQMHRMLKVTYKTAWFMAHRIREAMTNDALPPIGGAGKVVEADETYFGKREIPIPSEQRRGRPYLKRGIEKQKRPVVALVERGGEVRVMHMPHVTGANIRAAIIRHVDRKSRLHTDESPLYLRVGSEFAKHESVKHSVKEYVRGDVTTNTVEGFFGVLKRGMKGIYQHCGEQHLDRYLNEFAFRYNNRSKLGVEDAARALTAVQGAAGKRLTYRRVSAA